MPAPMLTLEEAQGRLLDGARLTDAERVPLLDAFGRVLADPRVVAAVDVPPFANSAMDGYAVRSADGGAERRLVGESAAGSAVLPTVEAGTAARIMTGAPMPPGADAVVPVEEASEDADRVVLAVAPEAGAHVRDAAHDTRAGDSFTLAGRLSPARLAVLASIGVGEVEVRRRPVVAVLSTGDELVAPGGTLGPGQIHDANGVALAAAVTDAGGSALLLPSPGDDAEAISDALSEAVSGADLVVSSGGVSMGRHDHVRDVIQSEGALAFWRIAIQPGKPVAVGSMGGVTVVGLPGNPVSALVTFELFVRPLIRAMLGLSGDGRARLRAVASDPMRKDPARRAFFRVVLSSGADGWRARPAGGQGSSQLRPMADANALLVVPEGVSAAEAGETYEAIVLEATE